MDRFDGVFLGKVLSKETRRVNRRPGATILEVLLYHIAYHNDCCCRDYSTNSVTYYLSSVLKKSLKFVCRDREMKVAARNEALEKATEELQKKIEQKV